MERPPHSESVPAPPDGPEAIPATNRLGRATIAVLAGLLLLAGGASGGYLVGRSHRGSLSSPSLSPASPSASPTSNTLACLNMKAQLLSLLGQVESTESAGNKRYTKATSKTAKANIFRQTAGELVVLQTQLRTITQLPVLSEAYADISGATTRLIDLDEGLAMTLDGVASAGAIAKLSSEGTEAISLSKRAHTILQTAGVDPCS